MPGTDRPPSFQFFPRDFISDPHVQALTLEELGAYIRLLCFAWLQDNQGHLDMLTLPKLSGLNEMWAQHEQAISRCFDTSKPGLWVQKRMVATRREQRRNYERARGAALARWHKDLAAQQHPSTVEGNALASASAVESKRSKDSDSVPVSGSDNGQVQTARKRALNTNPPPAYWNEPTRQAKLDRLRATGTSDEDARALILAEERATERAT